jgi:uncharacterized protein (TIGR02246 family)
MKRRKVATLTALVLGVALGGFASTALMSVAAKAEPADGAAKEDRAGDRAAIGEVRKAFAAAFHKGDAEAAAAFLTSGAELIPDERQPVRGRSAIQKAFASHFAKKAKAKITLKLESLRFLSRDLAVEEGNMKVVREEGEPELNRYSITYAREDGKWLLAVIREWEENKEADLGDLAWLIGMWAAKTRDSEVETVYDWLGNKAFIRGRFTVRQKDKTFSGMQLIGLDPQNGGLRTWTFERDGGFGEGTCTRDGKKWIFDGATAMPDGRVLTAQNILLQINKDTFTWQAVNLAIDGEEIKDLAPVKVTRVKDTK